MNLRCDFLVQFKHVLCVLKVGFDTFIVFLVGDTEAVGHLDSLFIDRTCNEQTNISTFITAPKSPNLKN